MLRCDESVQDRPHPTDRALLAKGLSGSLPHRQVSLTRLSQYLMDQQPASPALLDTEREELRNSLVLTQESAAIQILRGVARRRWGGGWGQTEGCAGDSESNLLLPASSFCRGH